MVPLPNPSCEARNHRWRRRAGGAKSGRALTKQHILCPKTSFFGPKRLRNPVKTDKRRKGVRTMHVRLDSLVTKHPWFTSKSTMCPRHGPKMAKNGPKLRTFCVNNPQNRESAIYWATWLKHKFRGHLVHPQTPIFWGFQPSKLPDDMPKPPYQRSLAGARGQPGPCTVGAVDPPCSPRRRDYCFAKMF